MSFLVEQLFGSPLMVAPVSPPLDGRVVVITGSNTGLGLQTAIHLANLNPSKLIMAVRTISKGQEAERKVRESVPGFKGDIEVWQLDLASFESVLAFGDRLNSSLDRLDIFCENSAVATQDYRVTADGWEETLQVNALSTGLLALLALPLLNKTSKLPAPVDASKHFQPHLTIVSSEVHAWAAFPQKNTPGSTLAALNDKTQFVGRDRYNVSKLLNQFLAAEISQLPLAQGIVVNTVNPGLCVSELRRELNGVIAFILDLLARTAEKGARNIAWACVSDTSSKPAAYISLCQIKPPSAYSTSAEGVAMQKKLFSEMSVVWKGLSDKVATILA